MYAPESGIAGPPPDVAWSPGGVQGQASKLLGFLKEIKGKQTFGPVCHSLVGFCGTAVQANVAFWCRAGSIWCDACMRFAEAKDLPTPHPTPIGGRGGVYGAPECMSARAFFLLNHDALCFS